jgi:CSLREA domain-containing protein
VEEGVSMRTVLLCTFVLCAGCFPDPGQPGYFVVDTVGDEDDVAPGDGVCRGSDGHCSLRAAVEESNALRGPQTIDVPAGAYALGHPGGLLVTDDVLIAGAGSSSTLVTTEVPGRVFGVTSGSLWLLDTTISGGDGTLGILAGADAILIRSVVTGGLFLDGGAVNVAGRLLVDESTISRGEAFFRGGGIFAAPGSLVIIGRSTLEGNIADHGGGAIYNAGELHLFDSTISGNTSVDSGGLINTGSAHLLSVTITDNSSDSNSDTSPPAGGISNQGSLSLRDTIIAGNHGLHGASTDCAGTLQSRGHNLLGDPTGCTLVGGVADLVGLAPDLGPLADNGGLTRTHAVLPDSPALDAGSRFCEPVDQRGVRRPQGPACDIGAYERREGRHVGTALDRHRHDNPRNRIPDCHEMLPQYLWDMCPATR